MTASQVAADLRAAAEVLKRDGWCQLQSHSTSGEHCAAGALEAVVDPNWQGSDGWQADQSVRFASLNFALQEQVGGAVTMWNDAPGRTADEVITALLAAADAAEADQ